MTPDELTALERQGYLGPFRAFEPAEMVEPRRIVAERVLATPSRYSIPERARHLDSRTVFALSAAPAIVTRMVSLLGPDLLLWATHLFDKSPAGAAPPEEFPWHQDWYTWRLEPMTTVTAWLALTPATRENGCLEVIPGSHRSRIPHPPTTDPRYNVTFGGRRADPAQVAEGDKLELPMDAGEFVLFNERLLHHSNPNRTRERRLALAVRVAPTSVRVNEPFPCVVLAGRDRFGLNPMVDPPVGEPDESDWWTSLPWGSAVAFDRPVPGLGWYLPESDGRRSYCWSGPGAESWLDLRVPAGGDCTLVCTIAHVIAPACLAELELRVNRERLPYTRHADPGGVRLEARVPARALRDDRDRARVTVRVPRTVRPCDLDPRSPDTRPLGWRSAGSRSTRAADRSGWSGPVGRVPGGPPSRSGRGRGAGLPGRLAAAAGPRAGRARAAMV
jgi:hypothetical protein